ncbi:MAG: family NAD(P)-dependent oxidoreductase [Rhodospirillales bacterium]|nr:family NAD(P)-dependent oxidoreductase [Rhodospirillales bacterium]
MARKWTVRDIPSQRGKLAVITGANRGLGLEITTALACAGAHVVMAVRNQANAAAALKEIARQAPDTRVEIMTLDQADLASIQRFSGDFHTRFSHLDLLVNNASAILVHQSKTHDGFESHIGINHLGSFALTGLLLDRLTATKGARIVNTASTAHRLVKGIDLDDLQFERTPYKAMEAYGKSKLAALLFTAELDRRLRTAGLDTKAVAAHPGYSNTNPDKGGFLMRLATAIIAQPPAMGALPQLYAATAPDVAGGNYYGPAGIGEMRGYPAKVGCTPAAKDEAVAARLWDLSEKLTGVSFLDYADSLPR